MIFKKNSLLLFLFVSPAILSCFGQSSFFVRADEDEIENDDDVIAETEEADVDDDGTDLESTGEEGDEGPSTSQDVDTTILFTKPKLTNDMELPAGQIVEFLVGFTNKAEYDFVVESVDAAFHYPLDHSFVVQNFSALRYNRDVKPTNEITVAYSFIPADAFTGRPLSLAINLNYRDLEGRMFRDTVFNETMNIVEFSEGIDTEMIFLYLIMASVVILALVAGQQFLGSYTKKRMSGNRSSDAQKNKQTSGIDYDWIPKATLQQINKSPKGSPRRSPRLRKGKSADSGEE